MGIDLTQFAIDNLIEGYREKSFSKVQISIFSMNYMMRGILTNDDIDFINSELDKIDIEWEEQAQKELEEQEMEEMEELEDSEQDVEEEVDVELVSDDDE